MYIIGVGSLQTEVENPIVSILFSFFTIWQTPFQLTSLGQLASIRKQKNLSSLLDTIYIQN